MASYFGFYWPHFCVWRASTLKRIDGRMIPQALCARYGLAIGAFFAWPVRILMYLVGIIAYPMATLLDAVLGKHDGIVYRRAGNNHIHYV